MAESSNAGSLRWKLYQLWTWSRNDPLSPLGAALDSFTGERDGHEGQVNGAATAPASFRLCKCWQGLPGMTLWSSVRVNRATFGRSVSEGGCETD
jgi:hypothetical protein